MSFLGRLFGSDKVIQGVVKDLHTTVPDERQRSTSYLTLLQHYEPFKLIQRLLALIISLTFVAIWVLAVVLFLVGAVLDSPRGEAFEAIARTIATINNDTLGLPVTLILSLYFAGGAAEGVVERFRHPKPSPRSGPPESPVISDQAP